MRGRRVRLGGRSVLEATTRLELVSWRLRLSTLSIFQFKRFPEAGSGINQHFFAQLLGRML